MTTSRAKEWRATLKADVASEHRDVIETSVAGGFLALTDPSGFSADGTASGSASMYEGAAAADIYRNFLNWLFATFQEDEPAFRAPRQHRRPARNP